jgi:hypothetical protein
MSGEQPQMGGTMDTREYVEKLKGWKVDSGKIQNRKFALTLTQMEQRKSGPRGGLSPRRGNPKSGTVVLA